MNRGRTDPDCSEVRLIGRQQFLAELSKLLTFMYEEDRQRALKMYERMFDIAEDDQGLIQHLMSPTRQAVVIARAYDAKERTLSVSTQKKEEGLEESEEIPRFVLAINRVFDDLFPEEDGLKEQEEDQVSFFDLGVEHAPVDEKKPTVPPAEVLLSDTQNFQVILPSDETAEEGPEEEPEAPEETAEEETAEPEEEPEESLEVDSILQSVRDMFPEEREAAEPSETEEDTEAEPAKTAEEESAAEDEAESGRSEEVPTSPEEPTEPAETASPEAAALDILLPAEDEAAGKEPPKTETDEIPASETDEPVTDNGPDPAEKPERKDLLRSVKELFPEAEEEARGPIVVPEKKPAAERMKRHLSAPVKQETSVPRLVLFLIAAIPITVALLALLLTLTLVSVVAAVATIALGATLILAAFSGFAVLADILLLFGAAIVALSLGLVFLWVAIWIVCSVMVGLVRSVRELSIKWCSKEVPAE